LCPMLVDKPQQQAERRRRGFVFRHDIDRFLTK
jgi:hypothetical protein